MMRNAFWIATAIFWLAVLAFGANDPRDTPEGTPPAQSVAVFPIAEVARHASPDDCWMAIDGQVYDLSAYLPEHPSRPSIILPWCGREASEAYRTKTRGRPHSPEADRMLADYRIGALAR